MNKGIGFSRKIELDWLDAAAAFALEGLERTAMREKLRPIIASNVTGVEAQRKTLDVLMAVWHKTLITAPAFHAEGLRLLPLIQGNADRLALHYGMVLVTYDLFRRVAMVLGRNVKLGAEISRLSVKAKISGEVGHLGALDRSVERILESIEEWGILTSSGSPKNYTVTRTLDVSPALKTWLVSCAIFANPSGTILFNDIRQLMELFPFGFELTLEELKTDPRFEIQRQGGGIIMIGVSTK